MRDLREWLDKVEGLGELRALRGVPWDLEIGVITEMVGRQWEKPALLFDDIPGYPSGFRVLSNSLGSRRRFALTFGFPLDTSRIEMVRECRRRAKEMGMLPPRFVDGGPVMENTLVGEEVDLSRFPAPKWHEKDGGRYIGTGDMVITTGPDGGWVNVGTYRAMVQDRNHVTIENPPTRHGRRHLREWHARGKAMPVAIALGVDPLLFVASATELPQGVSEYDWAGAVRGEPVEVIKGPITGLPIPAAAEIVLEGFVEPMEMLPEGPFGEFTGYYCGGVRPMPAMRIEAIHYRNNPIILGAPPLRPPDTGFVYMEAPRSALWWDALEAAGVPDVTGVWCHVTRGFFIVVSIRQRYPGHAKQAGRIACMYRLSEALGRYVVVVDEDIDATDIDEVLWAMCTRVDPDRDIEVMRECPAGALDPTVHPDRRRYPMVSRMVIDATRPYEWRDRFPEVVASSPELKQQVLARWGEALQGIL